MVTLFAELPSSRRGPSAFAVSMLLHGLATGLLYFSLRHTIKVEDELMVHRYTVRLLNLQRPEPKIWRPLSRTAEAAQGRADELASGGQPSAFPLPEQLAQLIPAPQTLVQPDLPPNLLLPQEIPIPLVVMWSTESSTARKIVLPPTQEKATSDARPDLDTPNHEMKIADLKISASTLVTDTPSPLPSTTSPVVVRGPELIKRVPETTSKADRPSVPARILSLSDLRLDQGTIALPLANETAAAVISETIAPTSTMNPSEHGESKAASKQSGRGAGEVSANQAGEGADANSPGRAGGTKDEADSGASGAADAVPGVPPTITRIVMPKDGKFGVVVVGSSMAEEYPETVGLWGSRMAYTVYLHVGLHKSWILQYSLPPEDSAAENGSVARLEAPWPFLMERPDLAQADLNGDAIMIHGFVNTSGRFEQLSVLFPAGFAQSKLLLGALEQWQFRAAVQNGLLTAVEVLLIIPAEAE
jgi:hypothetical protein